MKALTVREWGVRRELDWKYYSKNDESHKIEHADDVFDRMLIVNEKLDLELERRLVFLTAYLHDMFCHVSRKKHHELTRDFVLNSDEFGLWTLSTEEREVVATAVYEHRSSTGCEYSNHYSLAIQIADKGKPDLRDMVHRSTLYHGVDDIDKTAKSVFSHLQEKFSRTGYGIKCDFYKEFYKEELDKLWDTIDALTIEKIKDIIREIT